MAKIKASVLRINGKIGNEVFVDSKTYEHSEYFNQPDFINSLLLIRPGNTEIKAKTGSGEKIIWLLT